MFDVVVSSVASQRYLHQSVNTVSDTEVKIKGNGELTTEIRLEWHSVNVTKGFHEGLD